MNPNRAGAFVGAMPPLDVLAAPAAPDDVDASLAAFETEAVLAAASPAAAAEDEMPEAADLEAWLEAADGLVAVVAAAAEPLVPVMVMPAWPPAAAVEVPSATTRLTRAAKMARVNFILGVGWLCLGGLGNGWFWLENRGLLVRIKMYVDLYMYSQKRKMP